MKAPKYKSQITNKHHPDNYRDKSQISTKSQTPISTRHKNSKSIKNPITGTQNTVQLTLAI